MEIGCGARVRDFDGRRYFYFWHYERDNGRSVRKEEYVGRVDSERGRPELLRRIAAYHRKAEGEFARRRARVESLISAAYTSTRGMRRSSLHLADGDRLSRPVPLPHRGQVDPREGERPADPDRDARHLLQQGPRQ